MFVFLMPEAGVFRESHPWLTRGDLKRRSCGRDRLETVSVIGEPSELQRLQRGVSFGMGGVAPR